MALRMAASCCLTRAVTRFCLCDSASTNWIGSVNIPINRRLRRHL